MEKDGRMRDQKSAKGFSYVSFEFVLMYIELVIWIHTRPYILLYQLLNTLNTLHNKSI